NVVDTSAVASSVRAEARSELQRIDVTWSASVPWSNVSPEYPVHLVYRGSPGQDPEDFELVGNVDVTADGFIYIDQGLEDVQIYCYRVLTRGTYGNPEIDEPLENYSQVVCAQPSDTIPPCQVALPVAIDAPDCDNYTGGCGETVLSNRIAWQRPVCGKCQNDIDSYNIYVSATMGGEFVLHATGVRDLFFEDKNLASNARCYRVAAVDRSGNVGPLSDPVCIDNCPYYELPNIFTPNGDKCN